MDQTEREKAIDDVRKIFEQLFIAGMSLHSEECIQETLQAVQDPSNRIRITTELRMDMPVRFQCYLDEAGQAPKYLFGFIGGMPTLHPPEHVN